MSLALLFTGQGVQHETMLRWIDDDPAAAPVLAALGERIGAGWRSRLVDTGWAESNAVAQCLSVGCSLAAWTALRHAGLPAPSVIAGCSVGELAAFCAASVFDVPAALDLAGVRSAAMDRASVGRDDGLLSVRGPPAAAVDEACRRWRLEVAIRIALDHQLLGGAMRDLEGAEPALRAAGAELSWLRVHVASHTSLMRPAAAAFQAHIDAMRWQAPQALLVCNRDGAPARRDSELKRRLAEQIDTTVQWQRCMEAIAERRPRCVLEVGAGSSLSRLWLAAQPTIPARSADEFGSAAAAVAWVRSQR